MKKLILAIAVFALSAAAASNVFHVTLSDPAWVGTTELKPGDYKVEAAGDKAVLKMGKTSVELPAKLETAEHKFSTTAVVMHEVQGKNQITAMELGGTNERLVFVNAAAGTE